jgi:hypothetical protein
LTCHLLSAAEDDDVDVVQDDDEGTYPAGLLYAVAPWSSRCIVPVAGVPVCG